MKIFDRYCEKYDAWYEEYPEAFISEVAAIKKVLPRGKDGLEIGVGTGRFAASLGIRTGIDPSFRMVELAKARGIAAFPGSGERLPFPAGSFDYVAIILTLCFVKDAPKVLRESARVLKKKGRIIVAIIDRKSFLGKIYRSKKRVFYRYAHFFTIREITRLLKQAGFKDQIFYQTILTPPEKMKVAEKPKKGHGRGGFVVAGAVK